MKELRNEGTKNGWMDGRTGGCVIKNGQFMGQRQHEKGSKDEKILNLILIFLPLGPVKSKPTRKVQSASRREYVLKYDFKIIIVAMIVFQVWQILDDEDCNGFGVY